jgi:hypothetical protein
MRKEKIYLRALPLWARHGPGWCMVNENGQPLGRVREVGAFARALVRRQLGHDNFVFALI